MENGGTDMIVLTFSDIITLNKLLLEKRLNYKIHLNDACGSQSFRIEKLDGGEENENDKESFYEELESFFKSKGADIQYNITKTEFWVKR
jgi:hypothetical protein